MYYSILESFNGAPMLNEKDVYCLETILKYLNWWVIISRICQYVPRPHQSFILLIHLHLFPIRLRIHLYTCMHTSFLVNWQILNGYPPFCTRYITWSCCNHISSCICLLAFMPTQYPDCTTAVVNCRWRDYLRIRCFYSYSFESYLKLNAYIRIVVT